MEQFRVLILFCRIQINNFKRQSMTKNGYNYFFSFFVYRVISLNFVGENCGKLGNCENWNGFSPRNSLRDFPSSFRWNSKQKFKILSNFDVQSSMKLKKKKEIVQILETLEYLHRSTENRFPIPHSLGYNEGLNIRRHDSSISTLTVHLK